MMPMTTRLLMILKSAKSITISPADLKKTPDFALFLMLKELNPMSAENRQGAKRECEHREPAREEATSGEAIELHRLCEAAGEEERRDADEKWCEHVIHL